MSVRRGHRTGGKSHSRVPANPGVTENNPSWSRDGRLAFSANRAEKYGDLFVMNANGSARRNVTATPNVSEWDPDSSPTATNWRSRTCRTAAASSSGGSMEPIPASSTSAISPVWGRLVARRIAHRHFRRERDNLVVRITQAGPTAARTRPFRRFAGVGT
jgi:WD40-like Beta Propeller Repeat